MVPMANRLFKCKAICAILFLLVAIAAEFGRSPIATTGRP
jgi:hypothetical protein